MSDILQKRAPARNAGASPASAAPARSGSEDGRRERGQGARKGGGGRSLGIYAKSIHTLRPVAEAAFDPMEIRAQRFALQSVARQILSKSNTPFRIANCLRVRAFGQDVAVWKSAQFRTAHYTGLQTCGSVSACPVCSAKIGERRRAEVLAAMTVHEARGGNVHLLTLTAPHQRGDVLADLLAQQAKALARFWNDRKVKAVLVEMGYTGQIRAWEVTHGRMAARNNGWHPHFHILLFTGVGVDLARFNDAQRRDWAVRLYLVWAKACEFAGLGTPSFEHGLKLDDGSKASAYVTKWGLEDELTKGYSKRGKAGSETPFDLLRAVLADGSDHQAAALFREFAEAFKGRRQLYWSKGLKASFSIDETTDDEIADRAEEEALFLGLLTVDQWRDVLKLKARATVLEIAARCTWEDVQRFLYIIKDAHAHKELPSYWFDVAAEARQLILDSSTT